MQNPASAQPMIRSRNWRKASVFVLPLLMLGISGGVLFHALPTADASNRPRPTQAAGSDILELVWSAYDAADTTSVVWGDYDGDGDLDLAVGNLDQPTRLYRNDGQAGSSPQLTLAWSSADIQSVENVAWVDYDGDGDLDLSIGSDCRWNLDCQPMRLYRNDHGTLMTEAVWSSPEVREVQGMAWGDYDGDGDFDLAVGREDCFSPIACLAIYRNDGTQGGTPQLTLALTATNWAANTLAWTDYDSDGDLDLSAGPLLHRNDGTLEGVPQLAAFLLFVDGINDVTHIAWGDYDADGNPDLAASVAGQSRIYHNNGIDLSGTPVMILTWTGVGDHLGWGDYDGDGDLDLVVGSETQPVQLYRNDGSVNGVPQMTLAWSSTLVDHTTSMAWGDYDGDGDLDLAVGNQLGRPVRLYRNDKGTLSLRVTWELGISPSWKTEWVDYDGDGYLDLSMTGWQLALYHNDQGILATDSIVSLGNQGRASAWGDYDHDGDLDLAWAEGVDGLGSKNLYRNDGVIGGIPQLPQIWSVPDPESTTSMAWGDVDGDGDLDLATIGTSTQLYHNGPEGLTPWAVWTAAHGGTGIAWGDADNDGDLDLATIGETIQLYLNDHGSLTPSAVWVAIDGGGSSLAWGDYDGDDDLDLAVGDSTHPSRLYRNDSGTLTTRATWLSIEAGDATSVAWGDVDGDGDLDLVIGNSSSDSRVYRNNSGVLTSYAVWSALDYDTQSLAWGDVDNDGDLDLAVGTALYHNGREGRLLPGAIPLVSVKRPGPDANFYSSPQIWSGVIPMTYTLSDSHGDPVQFIRAWYSPDGGGQWQPAVAASGTLTTNLSTATFTTQALGSTTPVAIPDLALMTSTLDITSTSGIADIDAWLNLTHTFDSNLIITLTAPFSRSVLLVNRRGDGNDDFTNTIFDDEASTPIMSGTAPFTGRYRPEQILSRFDGYSPQGVWTLSIADVTAGNAGRLLSWGMTITLNSGRVYTYAWDVAGSGFFGQSDNVVFRLQAVPAIVAGTHNAVPGPYLYGAYASQTFPFRVRGTQVRVVSDTQPISTAIVYRLPAGQSGGGSLLTDAAGIPFHTDGQGYLQGRGELNLADQLLALAPVHSAIHYEGVVDLDGIDDYVIKNPLNAAPITATTISFWMRSADQDGQGTPLSYATTGSADEFLITNYNNLALYRGAISVTTGVSLTDGLWHHVAVTWREADGQIKLYKDGSAAYTGTLAASSLITSGSLVLGQDQNSLGGGFAPARAFKGNLDDIHIWNVALDETQIQNDMLKPLNGDEDGLVLTWSFDAPAAASIPDRTVWHNDGLLFGATWNSRSFGGYTVYHTNGTPTEIGLSTHSVTQTGVQTLTISAAHPLILFDLNVSLEWDAHKQTAYLQQLENDLAKASTYLYDFTNGQVALGQVTVHQNADDWLSSQVAVYATNRLRPLAVQGGLVTEPITDPQRSNIAYTPGQVRMGAVWNRYGEPGGDISDWPLALAHELSHYLLYQEDVYLGLNEDGLLIPLNTCTGSVMGDMYNPDNTEFIYDQSHWDANCFDTLANRTLGRTEWTTNRLWYPWLITPTLANAGPSRLPFDLTHITIMDPISPTDTLDDPTFYIDYQSGESSSSEARAYIIRSNDQGDYVVDLGSPLGGQNRVYARGAQPGDRLCVLDAARRQFGCEIIELGDERLRLKADATWQPVVQLTPVNSQTIAIEVSGLTETLPLIARLYPENSYGGESITLTSIGAIYSGTFQLDFPAMLGHVQIWVDEPATEDNPRHEAMVTYSMGGNPGNWPALRGGWPALRGGWPALRGGWPALRGGWSASRSSSAPLASPGGQMLFFTADPTSIQEGNLYTIESMAGLPPLPAGKTAIGQGYSLIASSNVTQLITGSISFQYLSMDVLAEQADENQLTIHFWDGLAWQALDTVRSPYFNMVSAPGHGPGVYALLAGVTIPQLEAIDPVQAVNDVTTTLTIGGHDFLPPVDVLLRGSTATYTLPIMSVSPISITAIVTPGLPAHQYQVQVVNRYDASFYDAPSSSALPFALYDPADACFYDFFESGNGKWQRGGTWDIITLADGNQALTDSPGGSYGVAVSPTLTATTSITSSAFSLSGCSRPVLTFRHDYVIDSRPPSQDWGRVEISTDNGTTWHELAHYTGGLRTGLSKAIINSEWADAQWKEVEIDLSTYTGTVRLRFNLEIDRVGADRGWLMDNVLVRSKPLGAKIFLPAVLR